MATAPEERAKREQSSLDELRRQLQCFSNEELAWDFHTNLGREARMLISNEARARGINLCLINQSRRGGPFVPGWRWQRIPCGGKCGC